MKPLRTRRPSRSSGSSARRPAAISPNSFSVAGKGSTWVVRPAFSSSAMRFLSLGLSPWFMSSGPEPRQLLAGVRVVRMHGAHEARVVRAADVAHLDRVARIGDRRADERLLHRAALAVGGARPHVPRGRRDDLVVLDLAAAHLDPVAERAAHRFGGAAAAPVALGGLDVPDVLQTELAQDALGLAIELHHLVQDRKSVG